MNKIHIHNIYCDSYNTTLWTPIIPNAIFLLNHDKMFGPRRMAIDNMTAAMLEGPRPIGSSSSISSMTAEMFTFHDELARAVLAHNTDLLQALLEKADTVYRGANTHKLRTMTALLYTAVENRDVTISSLLLDGGANANGNVSEAKKPLFIAVEGGDVSTVTLLLDRGASIDIVSRGNTPLHDAVKNEHIAVVGLLLDRGANIQTFNAHQLTPLHIAASKGSLNIVNLLLDRGAEINAQDISNDSREYTARILGRPFIITDSTERTATPLHSAVVTGRTDVVALLIDRGADINAVGALKYTPLHLAVTGGYEPIVQLLLERGANVLAKNRQGNTALCLVGSRDARLAALLIASNPEVAATPCGNGRLVNLERFRDLRNVITDISEQGAVRRRKAALLSRVMTRRAEVAEVAAAQKSPENSKKRKSRRTRRL